MDPIVVILFLAIVFLTLVITYMAAKQTKSTGDFYTAGGGLTGWQNGLAIAGDYLSAASFLGIAGMIALQGFDGFFYSIGFLIAYLVVLFLVAEPLRNLGKYTLADMINSRFDAKKVRGGCSFKYDYDCSFLHDCTACWCWCTYTVIIRNPILDRCVNCWRDDDDLCSIWWNDCNELGTDYKGCPSDGWNDCYLVFSTIEI